MKGYKLETVHLISILCRFPALVVFLLPRLSWFPELAPFTC